MGRALAMRLHRAGHSVLLGVRNRNRASPDPAINVDSYQAAFDFGDLSILALPWPAVLDVVQAASVLPNRVIVDVTNPESPDGLGLSIGHQTSGAEEIAGALPHARIVKAFSHYYAELLADDVAFDGGAPSVLYCGDDPAAKVMVKSLIASCGLDPVDSGPLRIARFLEPFAMLTVALVRTQGLGATGCAWRLMRASSPPSSAFPSHILAMRDSAPNAAI